LALSAFADRFPGMPDEVRERLEKLIQEKKHGRRK
jgi:hypothetical protein